MSNSDRNVRRFTLVILGLLGVLFIFTDGFGVLGVITFFFAALYFVWDMEEEDDDDNNDDFYKLKLQ